MKTKIFLAALLLGSFSASAPVFSDEELSGRKLDQILENQSQILKEISEIKSELAIVKVRASDR